jgi:hypothetical protein
MEREGIIIFLRLLRFLMKIFHKMDIKTAQELWGEFGKIKGSFLKKQLSEKTSGNYKITVENR